MKKLHEGAEVRASIINEWWRAVDNDGSGSINFEEFLVFWAGEMGLFG